MIWAKRFPRAGGSGKGMLTDQAGAKSRPLEWLSLCLPVENLRNPSPDCPVGPWMRTAAGHRRRNAFLRHSVADRRWQFPEWQRDHGPPRGSDRTTFR